MTPLNNAMQAIQAMTPSEFADKLINMADTNRRSLNIGVLPDENLKGRYIRFVNKEVLEEIKRAIAKNEVQEALTIFLKNIPENGVVIEEKKDDEHSIALTTHQLAQKLSDGQLQLVNGSGATKKYTKIEKIDKVSLEKFVESIAKAFKVSLSGDDAYEIEEVAEVVTKEKPEELVQTKPAEKPPEAKKVTEEPKKEIATKPVEKKEAAIEVEEEDINIEEMPSADDLLKAIAQDKPDAETAEVKIDEVLETPIKKTTEKTEWLETEKIPTLEPKTENDAESKK